MCTQAGGIHEAISLGLGCAGVWIYLADTQAAQEVFEGRKLEGKFRNRRLFPRTPATALPLSPSGPQ